MVGQLLAKIAAAARDRDAFVVGISSVGCRNTIQHFVLTCTRSSKTRCYGDRKST